MKRLAGLEDVGVKRVADGGFASWLTILAHYCSLARINSGGAELCRNVPQIQQNWGICNQQRSTVGYRRNVEVAVVSCRSVLDVGKERKFEKGAEKVEQPAASNQQQHRRWSRVTRTAGWDWRGGKGGGEFGAMRESPGDLEGASGPVPESRKRPCSRFLGAWLGPFKSRGSRVKICWSEFSDQNYAGNRARRRME